MEVVMKKSEHFPSLGTHKNVISRRIFLAHFYYGEHYIN